MTKALDLEIYGGGCHCSAVRFQVLIDRFIAWDCNCSICQKKGFLDLIVPSENFSLLQAAEVLTSYTLNTRVARHLSHSVCGIHAFYHLCSHLNMIDVNLRCVDKNIINKFSIRPFDGQNWEDNVNQIQD
ncbi:MAG: GFA family protein [Cyanobacteria bacterium J06621_8]